MEKEELNNLLKRYKDGSSSAIENSRLESWFDARSNSGSWAWTDAERDQTEASLKLKIDAEIARKTSVTHFKPLIWAAAASILLIMAIAILFYQNPDRAAFLRELSYSEINVPAGGKIKFTLSDGSSVVLNGLTTIKYPKTFSGSKREVILVEGEALFDVKHDEAKPFIVKANGASIRVLGTAFNVKSYPTMKDTRVTVLRGKVAVNETSSANRHLLLLPDEQVSVNKVSGDLLKSHIDSHAISGWTEGNLIFDNETLANIAETLHRTKNISMNFNSEDIKSIRCSTTIEQKDLITDIASSLARANGLTYTIKNNEVLFSKKSAAM